MKANKEKVIAEKREKERLRAMREQEKREQLANYATPHSTAHGGSSSGGNAVGGGEGRRISQARWRATGGDSYRRRPSGSSMAPT